MAEAAKETARKAFGGMWKRKSPIPTVPYWRRVRNIVAIGRNYADHIAELGNQRPTKPFFFLKPTSSILPPSHTAFRTAPKKVFLPHGVNVQYEVELAVIAARPIYNIGYAKKVLTAEAYENLWKGSILGYTIGIDLTGRNLQDEAKKAGLPWTASKGYNTFLPLGKFIPKEKIPDPHDVRLELQINGEVKQNDSTSLMLFKIPELFEAVSDVMTLNKWDILLTGTPKGVGPVVHNDVMKASCYLGDQLIESFEVQAQDRTHRDRTPW